MSATFSSVLPSPTDEPGQPPSLPDVDRRQCRLLGPTALVVQALMGVLVILSLVYKRQREQNKRPWRIWLFDVSKQVLGQIVVHLSNVFISDLVAHHSYGNPCVLYFLNILVDTTLGVGLIYLFLHLATYFLSQRLHLKGFESGSYGDPSHPSLVHWARQAAVYILALLSMKFCVVALFAIWPGIFKVGEWLLSWTGSDEDIQVIVVMGFIPIVLNVLQFWLIDSIVKASNSLSFLPSSPPLEDHHDQEPLFASPGSDSEDDDDDSSIPAKKRPSRSRNRSEDLEAATPVLEHSPSKGSTSSERNSTTSSSTAVHPHTNLASTVPHTYPPSSSTPRHRSSPVLSQPSSPSRVSTATAHGDSTQWVWDEREGAWGLDSEPWMHSAKARSNLSHAGVSPMAGDRWGMSVLSPSALVA